MAESARAGIEVGTRVVTGTKKGTVRFIGSTEFAAGEWIGIELDEPEGKNSGTVNGVEYFTCPENHGLFAKKAQVRLETEPSRLEQLRAKRAGHSAPSLSAEIKEIASAKDETSPSSAASAKERKPDAALLTTPRVAVARSRRESATSGAAPSPTPTQTPEHTSRASAKDKDRDDNSDAGSTTSSVSVSTVPARKTTRRESTSAATRAPEQTQTRPTSSAPKKAAPGISRRSSASPKQMYDSTRSDLESARNEIRELQDTIRQLRSQGAVLETSKTDVDTRVPTHTRGEADVALLDEIKSLKLALKESEGLREQAHRCAVLEEENQGLRAQLLDLETSVRVLQAKQQQVQETEMERNVSIAKDQAAVATAKRRISELEAQLLSANDSMEMLTLDKEQLALDQELLQDRVAELESEVETLKLQVEMSTSATGSAVTDPQILQQNDKLKEALRRLRDASVKEQEEMRIQLRTLQKAADELGPIKKEAEELRVWKAGAEKQLSALQESVDESNAYRDMLERLTERNLELNDRLSQHNITISDLEAAQELYEELDSSQKEEIYALQRQVEEKEVALRKSHEALKVQDKQIQELRGNLQRFRGIIENLRKENEELQSQANEESERFEQALGQAKTAMSTKQLLRLANEKATRLEIEGILAQIDKRRFQAAIERFGMIVCVDSIVQEMQLCTVEVTIAQAVDLSICAFELLSRSNKGSETESLFDVLPRAITETDILQCLLQSVHIGRCAIYLLSNQNQPAAVTVSLSSRFSRVISCLTSFIRMIEVGTPGSNQVFQDLNDAIQSCASVEPLMSILKPRSSSPSTPTMPSNSEQGFELRGSFAVVLHTSLCMWSSAVHAQQLANILMSLARASSLPTDTKDSVTTTYHNLSALSSDLLRLCSSCASIEVLLNDLNDETRQGIRTSDAALLQISRGLAAFWPEVTSSLESVVLDGTISEIALPQTMQVLSRLEGFGDRVRQQIQGMSLEGVVGIIPGLLSRESVWSWLWAGSRNANAAWKGRAQALQHELEENMGFKDKLFALQEQYRIARIDLEHKNLEAGTLVTRVKEVENLLEQSQAKQVELKQIADEVETLRGQTSSLTDENRVLLEAISVFEKNMEEMEATQKRLKTQQTSGTSKGDMVPSEEIEALKTAIQLVGDEAKRWRLAATSSLVSGLGPLTHAPPAQLGLGLGLGMWSGVSEEKKAEEKPCANEILLKCQQDVHRAYKDARMARARVVLVDLKTCKGNAAAAVLAQKVESHRLSRTYAAALDQSRALLSQVLTFPSTANQVVESLVPGKRLDGAVPVGRVSFKGRVTGVQTPQVVRAGLSDAELRMLGTVFHHWG